MTRKSEIDRASICRMEQCFITRGENDHVAMTVVKLTILKIRFCDPEGVQCGMDSVGCSFAASQINIATNDGIKAWVNLRVGHGE